MAIIEGDKACAPQVQEQPLLLSAFAPSRFARHFHRVLARSLPRVHRIGT
jgi:hypothetical protein